MSKRIQESSPLAWAIIGLFTFGVVAFVGFKIFGGSFEKPVSQKTTREVALTCTTDMATQFHIHPKLKIIIASKEQEIPRNIGVMPTCMYSLHTHDNTGVIHVEAPEKKDFTLADFFAVWQKTFTKDQILDYKADENNVIRMTVNGRESLEYENLILRDNDEIIIYYEEKK